MTYSYFATRNAAEAFLSKAKSEGRRGFLINLRVGEYQVRTWA